MRSILEVADAAEVIVNGYAFTKAGNNVKVYGKWFCKIYTRRRITGSCRN